MLRIRVGVNDEAVVLMLSTVFSTVKLLEQQMDKISHNIILGHSLSERILGFWFKEYARGQ